MFKQNEKYYQKLFQICDDKYKSLIIAIHCFAYFPTYFTVHV